MPSQNFPAGWIEWQDEYTRLLRAQDSTKVPKGGAASQILSKVDGADWNLAWTSAAPSVSPYIEVANYAALPAASANTGAISVVQNSTGLWPVRRPAGLWRSDGTSWTWLGNFAWTGAELAYTPTGTIAATNVQAAIDEAVTDQSAINATLVPQLRSVATTAPLQGGGDLSATLNLSISPSTGSAPGSMSILDFTKLAGIATGATANATDALLRDRTTHTGSQVAATISDFTGSARAQVEASLLAGANITITPSGVGASRQLTIAAAAGTTGTVTSASVVTANGISGTVATPTVTPAITLTLGAITPLSVAATGAVSGSNLSGTNTGDQTTITGNAGSATVLQTARTINGLSFNGSSNITINAVDATARVPATTTVSTTAPLTGGAALSGNLTLGINTFSSTLSGVVPGSGGGTTTFLRADGAWAAPVGVRSGTITLTLPSGEGVFEMEQAIAVTGVLGTDRILLSLAPHADTDENDPTCLSLDALSGTPATNQITVQASFSEATSGPIILNWIAS